MLINKDVIKKFNPCDSRFNNYLEHYKNFNGSIDDFLDLDKITYDDKIWVMRRILNKNQAVHFAILCAESVLSIYENKYPNDKRISDCLNYMKTTTDFSSLSIKQREKLIDLRNAAYAAADATADAAAYAADAAAYAANAAADAAAYAADAAAYAAAYAAANAAADAAAYAANAANAADYATNAARKMQQNHNLQLLKIAASL